MAAPTSISNTRVKRFSPQGVSDSLDATDEFPGACSALTNLIPLESTRNVWGCRPAAVKAMDFSACPNLPGGHVAGQVVVMKVVGSFVYGLFEDITLAQDTPFGYNLATATWLTITKTGITPATYVGNSGPPPTMDLIGSLLVVTHPNFSGPNFFGAFNISASPVVWTTGDLLAGGAITFASLGSIPAWVCQFNQRAVFGVNGLSQPSTVHTDVLALKVTNASQVLTYGDNLPLTAAGPLPLSNQLGGIIQALMVFKGTTNIYQVTGDFATTNIAINTLNVATGTTSPRTITRTPLGLAFVSPAGLRIIDQSATVSEPIGVAGTGVCVPFSVLGGGVLGGNNKMAAGCDGVTIRIGFVSQITFAPQEYWYDIPRKCWTGPHTFVGQQFDIWNDTFLVVPQSSLTVNIYTSGTDPIGSSTFTELGNPLTFTMQSVVLEDNAQMAGSELSEMQVVASAAANNTMTVSLLDPNGTVINTSSIVVNSTGLFPNRVDFPAQSVFNRAAVSITGSSAAGVRIGDVWMRLKTLGYIPPPPNPPSS